MSDLGDLLELLHTAHSRAGAVRAVIRKWSDTDLWQQSAQRWAELQPSLSTVLLRAKDGDGGGATRHVNEMTYRVWRDIGQDAWRFEDEQRGVTTILSGRRWWSSAPRREPGVSGWAPFGYEAGDFITNVRPNGSVDSGIGGSVPDRFIEVMLDPASLLSSMVFQPAGRSERVGRPVLDALAHWRKGISLVSLDWPYADEVRLSVDAEYGVLARLAFVLDGQTFLELWAEEVGFDEALSASLFEGPPATKGQTRLPDLP